MVASGLGVTLLPRMALETEAPPGGDLVAVPLIEPTHSRTIGLAWRHTSHRAEEYELLAKELSAHTPEGVIPIRR